jgi:ribosome modulation factor
LFCGEKSGENGRAGGASLVKKSNAASKWFGGWRNRDISEQKWSKAEPHRPVPIQKRGKAGQERSVSSPKWLALRGNATALASGDPVLDRNETFPCRNGMGASRITSFPGSVTSFRRAVDPFRSRNAAFRQA